MAPVFRRRLAIPLSAVAFSVVALTAPPIATPFLVPFTTVLAIAVLGIAAIVFLMSGSIPSLRTSRALVRVPPSGRRHRTSGNHSGNRTSHSRNAAHTRSPA
jgi:hypothetical protein